MNHFQYKDGVLHAEDVPLDVLAAEVGTPSYIYSRATLTRHFEVFDSAFEGISHLVCYSVKANSNLGVLSLLANMGAGMDIVSGGELHRCLAAGVSPGKTVYSGVGKQRWEMEMALGAGILMFNVESEQELDVLAQTARASRKTAPVSIRVNPDVDPKTHPYISTGLKKNKFGLEVDRALIEYVRATAMDGIEIKGISCHIGSQLTEIAPFVDALGRVLDLVDRLAENDITIEYLDLGGGLGITYADEEPPPPSDYGRAIKEALGGRGLTLILEPGRVIAGNGGILLTRVLYTKKGEQKDFVVVDAAMNDLVRPSLYQAYHEVKPVKAANGAQTTVDIVGPICETGDFVARDRALSPVRPGDVLAVMSAGAYGFTMSSNYNSRPRAAEVMVDGGDYRVVRARELPDDLIRGESAPDWSRGNNR